MTGDSYNIFTKIDKSRINHFNPVISISSIFYIFSDKLRQIFVMM